MSITHLALSKRIANWLGLIGLGLLLILVLSSQKSVSAQSTSQIDVRVIPETAEIPLNGTVQVAIEIVNVTDLYAFSLVLAFDPAVVQVVDSDPSLAGVQVALGTFMETGAAILNLANNPAGVIEFAFTQLNPSPPKSGTGNLIIITFSAVGNEGESPLIFLDGQLAQQGGSGLVANGIPGLIMVNGQPASGPTATAIPTQPVGTSFPTATLPANPGPTSTAAPLTTATSTSNPTQQPGQTATIQTTADSATAQPTAAVQSPAAPTATPTRAEITAEPTNTETIRTVVPSPTINAELALTVAAAITVGESVADQSNSNLAEAIGENTTAVSSGQNGESSQSNSGDNLQAGASNLNLPVLLIIGTIAILMGIGLYVLMTKR